MKLTPIIAALAVTAAFLPIVARAAPPTNITNTVGVCDPNAPTNCQAPFYATGATVSLSATSSSSETAVTAGPGMMISNTGTVTAYIAFGSTSSVVATTANYPVLAGQTVLLSGQKATFVAAITASGSATVLVTPGTGNAQPGGGGSGGGGGSTQTGAFVAVTPTIQNASYVSGNCMGGFQTVSLGTLQSVLSQVSLASQGGLVTAKQVYLFSANPSGSTCTDKSTFTIATADLSKIIATFQITPSVPTGTTKSFGSAAQLALGIPSGGTIYAAIVETATETPASTTDLVLGFSPF